MFLVHLLRAAALAAAVSPPLAGATPLTLQEALERAVSRSESTRAARADATSASEAARAAGELPDPVLRAGVDNLPVSGPDGFSTRDSMTMKRIGIGQEWLSSAKRAARQAVADAQVERQTTAADASAAEVRLQTGLAFIDASFAARAVDLAAESEHHAQEELAAARARLSAAAMGSQEVLALAGARDQTEDEVAEARQQQAAAQAMLQRWIGVVPDELAVPADMSVPSEQAYVGGHPAVLAAQREVELARHEAELAKANRTPNWSWELSYGQRTGNPDMLSFGVSIPLPIAPERRQDRETAARLAQVERARAAWAEATRMAAGEYRAMAGDARRLAERIERLRSSVVATARQRTAAALAAYRSNQLPLATLFEARHAEVEAQRKLLSLQRELARTQARLALQPLAEGAAR